MAGHMHRLDIPEKHFIETVREVGNVGTLAEMFEEHIRENDAEGFHVDDQECRTSIVQGIETYFSLNNLQYDPAIVRDISQEEFIANCREYATRSSLRELFANFYSWDKKKLPADNNVCRKVPESGIELYSSLQ